MYTEVYTESLKTPFLFFLVRCTMEGQESLTPPKAEYIGADHLPFFAFRLQLCGGPYIPIIPVLSRGRCNTGRFDYGLTSGLPVIHYLSSS